MIESNDQDWGLCDHGLVGREFDDDAEEDYGDAWDEFDAQDDDDDEWPMAHMASGRRYASTLTGEWLPVPAIRP